VSKERARRRAEREALAAVERERRQRSVQRRSRWRAIRQTVAAPFLVLRSGRRDVDSALGRRRRRENGLLAAGLLGAHAVLWLMQPSWAWRASALVLTVFVWPVLVVLAFDRRPTR
jgi:Flp pilus assembly protein TadB